MGSLLTYFDLVSCPLSPTNKNKTLKKTLEELIFFKVDCRKKLFHFSLFGASEAEVAELATVLVPDFSLRADGVRGLVHQKAAPRRHHVATQTGVQCGYRTT